VKAVFQQYDVCTAGLGSRMAQHSQRCDSERASSDHLSVSPSSLLPVRR